MTQKFGINFGAMCDPISDQLKAQGLKYDEKQVKTFEDHVDRIIMLRFAGLLTDSMVDKINQKLFNQVKAHVVKVNNLKAKPSKV